MKHGYKHIWTLSLLGEIIVIVHTLARMTSVLVNPHIFYYILACIELFIMNVLGSNELVTDDNKISRHHTFIQTLGLMSYLSYIFIHSLCEMNHSLKPNNISLRSESLTSYTPTSITTIKYIPRDYMIEN
jgi:hypothetical protein